MLVALVCKDRPGALQVRLDNRPTHRAYLDASPSVHLAGPLLDEGGEMIGSLIVLSVDTLDQAKSWAEDDPYAKAGLFESVVVREWKKVIG